MVNIKKRSPVLVFILTLITLGIYGLYWYATTKGKINQLGADIPTAILIIIPIINIFWYYKYAAGFSKYVKKDNNTVLWFLLALFLSLIAIPIFQMELNKLAE